MAADVRQPPDGCSTAEIIDIEMTVVQTARHVKEDPACQR
jgi:hypothetical protein